MLSQSELKKLLSYDKLTGHFTWLVQLSSRGVIGGRAGSQDKYSGYRYIRIRGKNYAEHQLVYLHVEGELVKNLDHKNGKRWDNRWRNLRRATRAQNNGNMRRADGKSKFKGVLRRTGRWEARVQKGGVSYYCGLYEDERDAALAYDAKAIELYGEFAHTNASMGKL